MFGLFGGTIGTLEGKVILITGCDSGFGQLMAIHYCAEGAHVYAGVLNEKNGQAIESEAKGKGRITALVLNVIDEQHIQDAFKRIKSDLEKEGKTLFALINNAGVTGGWYAEMTDMEIYRRMMDINYFGQVNMAKTFIPLLQNPGGRLIGVVSSAAAYAMRGTSVYSSTKFAHSAFMDALRNEMRGNGLHIIKVLPGGHNTAGTEHYSKVVAADQKYAAATEDIKSRYAPTLLQEFNEMVKKYQKSFADPMNVVKGIKEALLAKNPEACYTVGSDAWLMAKFLPLLPYSWSDWIQSKV